VLGVTAGWARRGAPRGVTRPTTEGRRAGTARPTNDEEEIALGKRGYREKDGARGASGLPCYRAGMRLTGRFALQFGKGVMDGEEWSALGKRGYKGGVDF